MIVADPIDDNTCVCYYLQSVDRDGASAPGVEVAEGVDSARTAKHHQPVQQLLLGQVKEHQRQACVCGIAQIIHTHSTCPWYLSKRQKQNSSGSLTDAHSQKP